jgi:hypothetical protein
MYAYVLLKGLSNGNKMESAVKPFEPVQYVPAIPKIINIAANHVNLELTT